MNNQEIIEFYNTHLNMNLSELSRITGKSVQELKEILLES